MTTRETELEQALLRAAIAYAKGRKLWSAEYSVLDRALGYGDYMIAKRERRNR